MYIILTFDVCQFCIKVAKTVMMKPTIIEFLSHVGISNRNRISTNPLFLGEGLVACGLWLGLGILQILAFGSDSHQNAKC